MSKVFRKWLIINLVTLGVLLLAVVAALILLRRDIIARANKTIEERNLFTFRSEGVRTLSTLREESRLGTMYRQDLESLLPREEELFAFSRTVDRFARARNLNLNFSFSQKQAASGDLAASISFNMNVEGQLGNIIRFFGDIEREKVLVKFNSVDVAQIGGGYSAKVSGQVFIREIAS